MKYLYSGCILFHFYIKPQPNLYLPMLCFSCILFHFYIKPQRRWVVYRQRHGCILFHFYIKPQLTLSLTRGFASCILFHFYIKPQHCKDNIFHQRVVSYSISTSNHNSQPFLSISILLYLIPFLHQTTTIEAQGG